MADIKLGRYVLESILGQGAMGVVYRAYDPEIGRKVAIKTIRLDLADTSFEEKELKGRFLNEARSAGTMNHPNIVTIYDVGYEGHIAFIAMEYIEGNDLKEYMNVKKEIPFKEMFRIIYSVAKGLDYSSSKKIIHRDIKPANVLLTNDGNVKISDFGIAKLPTSTVTQSGMLMGTPAYVSPEQVMGTTIDIRSDLYSLGVIFYELVSGKRPFTGDPTTVIFQVVQSLPPEPKIKLEGVPRDLKNVILKAIAKKPEDRFQTGEEFIEAIKSLKGIRKGDIDITSKIDFSPLPKRREKELNDEHIKKLFVEGGIKALSEGAEAADFGAQTVVVEDSPTQIQRRRIKRSLREFVLFVVLALAAAAYFYGDRFVYYYKKLTSQGTDDKVKTAPAKAGITAQKGGAGAGEDQAKTDAVIPTDLLIDSNPEGAMLLVNGEETGMSTPVIYKINEATPNEFRIALKKDCYQTFTTDVQKKLLPSDGIKADLSPLFREVALTPVPNDASVRLEGQDVPLAPPVKIVINCGTPIKMTVTKEGFVEKKVELNYQDQALGDNLEVQLIPALQDGFLNVSTAYPVTVFSDGKKIATIKKSGNIKFIEGKRKIKLSARKPVFINAEYNIDIKAKKTLPFTVPASGEMTVIAVPGNCRIWIDGINVDYAPLLNFKISAGDHTITYKWADGGSFREKIKIKPGETHSFTGVNPKKSVE